MSFISKVVIFVGKSYLCRGGIKMMKPAGRKDIMVSGRSEKRKSCSRKGVKIVKRIFVYGIVLPLLLCCMGILFCNYRITNYAKGRIFRDTTLIPYNKVGLLLGTSPRVRSGKSNLYFNNRIAAAAALYEAGKVKYILISGDNRRHNYNEPQAMKDSLLKRGIPKEVLVLDFAGLRTLDSVVRSKEIFGQDSVTVISQQFHNERAIFLARHYGIHAIGYNAEDVDIQQGLKTQVRELLARVKVYIDFFTSKQPRHLGERIEIPE